MNDKEITHLLYRANDAVYAGRGDLDLIKDMRKAIMEMYSVYNEVKDSGIVRFPVS